MTRKLVWSLKINITFGLLNLSNRGPTEYRCVYEYKLKYPIYPTFPTSHLRWWPAYGDHPERSYLHLGPQTINNKVGYKKLYYPPIQLRLGNSTLFLFV